MLSPHNTVCQIKNDGKHFLKCAYIIFVWRCLLFFFFVRSYFMRFIHGILRSFVYFPASLFSSGFAFAFACVTCIQIHTIHVFNMRVVSLFSGCAFIAVCTVHTYQLTQSLARLLIQRNAMSRNNCRFFFPFLITIIVSNKLASITVITIIFHELWCAIASMHGTSTMNE